MAKSANVLESDSLVRLAIHRHGTGTVDPVSSAPTHEDGAYGDDMEMLPLVLCLMSDFERELSSGHSNNWWNAHSPECCWPGNLCSGPKMDRRDNFTPLVPINVRSLIFNEILPILDWFRRIFLNNGHWLLGTDCGGTMWRWNKISPNKTKRSFLWIYGDFRWHFIAVNTKQIVHFPQ